MEFVVEAILQFLFEFILQVFVEVCGEIGLQSLAEVFKSRRIQNPWLASLGYFLLGATAGGISLQVFKTAMIRGSLIRVANLVLTPVLTGFIMVFIGRLRKKRGQELVRLDRFGYGFLFAFGMALVRFLYAIKPR